MVRLAFVSLMILACGCQAKTEVPALPAPAPSLTKTDIEQVIDASMNEFFVRKHWREWDKGDVVVLDPVWSPLRVYSPSEKELTTFDHIVEKYVGIREAVTPKNASAKGLETFTERKVVFDRIRNQYKVGTRVPSPTIHNLKSMTLDKRIVLQSLGDTSQFRGRGWFAGKAKLKEGTVRVYGKVTKPIFSPNGRFAFLSMSWVPWSVHSAEMKFYLEKTPSGWKVLYVGVTYFV